MVDAYNGIVRGRAGLSFAGASIVFIACGFGSSTPGYLDCDGCVVFGELAGVGRAWTIQPSFGQEHNDFTDALDETRRDDGIVFGYVANSGRQIVARLGRYDDARYSRLALA